MESVTRVQILNNAISVSLCMKRHISVCFLLSSYWSIIGKPVFFSLGLATSLGEVRPLIQIIFSSLNRLTLFNILLVAEELGKYMHSSVSRLKYIPQEYLHTPKVPSHTLKWCTYQPRKKESAVSIERLSGEFFYERGFFRRGKKNERKRHV